MLSEPNANYNFLIWNFIKILVIAVSQVEPQ